MKAKESIAILLFSRSAKRESYFKNWTNDANTNFQIAKHLISNTKEQLKSSPFPVFQVDEKLQVGNTFGERFAHAFRYVFNKGFDYVIAIGNDCSNLSMDWHEISRQLITNKTILGPDKRGGVYLIGISRDANNYSKFLQISWRSSIVFYQLKEQFANSFILDVKRDINTFHDIKKWNYLYSIIKVLLRNWILIHEKISIFSVYHLSSVTLRAPPIFRVI